MLRGWARGLVPVCLMLSTLASAQERVAVRAAAAILADGTRMPGAVLLIEDGRIQAIGKDLEIPKGYRVVDRSGSVLAPGLVEIDSRVTAPNDLREEAEAVDATSNAATAVDVGHRDVALLREAGVTTVVVLPEDNNVVSGQGCVLKTDPHAGIDVRPAPVGLSLTADVASRTRIPTSFAGARRVLTEALSLAKSGDPKGSKLLAEVYARKRGAVMRVDSEASFRAAGELARDLEFPMSLVDEKGSSRRLLDWLKGTGAVIVLTVSDLDDDLRDQRLPADLEKAGARVVLRAKTPQRSPMELRTGAVIAMRHGLSRGAAMSALTRTAALAAGVGDRVGDLAVGLDADFIVLSGDPLDLSSSLDEVWVRGRRVHSRSAE